MMTSWATFSRRRGAGLAGVLAIMTIAALAAFTMAAVTMSHATRAHRMVNAQHALFLAEGALAQAISRVKSDGAFGTRGETITYGEGNDHAWVTFDRANRIVPTVGSRTGILYSTNNLSGSNGTGSGGVSVASGTVHIVATGASGGQTRVVEALVGVPRYPYVVSAMGAVNAPGSLVLKAAESASAYLADPTRATATLPSSVGAQGGMTVAGDCIITGDVVAHELATIQLPLKAMVGGMVRSGNIRLPDIPLQKYDPLALITTLPVLTEASIGQRGQTLTLSDARHYSPSSGTLNVQGSLALSNAILYVDGDLEINGSLSGRGMLVVTGNAKINGAIDISAAQADQLTAVLVGGNLTLTSTGGTKYFQGLVYARGKFTASNITIAGIFMSGGGFTGSGGAANPNGEMTLDNVTAVYLPEATAVSIGVKTVDYQSQLAGRTYGNASDDNFAEFSDWESSTQDQQTLWEQAYRETLTRMGGSQKFGLYFNPYADTTSPSTSSDPYYRKNLGWCLDLTSVCLPVKGSNKMVVVRVFSIYNDAATGRVKQVSRSDVKNGNASIKRRYEMYLYDDPRVNPFQNSLGYINRPGTKIPGDISNLSEVPVSQQGELLEAAGTSLDTVLDFGYDAQKTLLDVVAEKAGSGTQSGGDPTVTFDLNQFFGTERPLRIIAWQEHE